MAPGITSHNYKRASLTTIAKLTDVNWLAESLAPDLQSDYANLVAIHAIVDTASLIEITRDNGATWETINDGDPVDANKEFHHTIVCIDTDLINIRSKTDLIVKRLVVESSYSEFFFKPASGDNLGDHIATQDLDMASWNILNVGYLESNATNPALVGALRLGNNEKISWRDSGNTFDTSLYVDSSEELNYDGGPQTNFNLNSNTQTVAHRSDIRISFAGVDYGVIRTEIVSTGGFRDGRLSILTFEDGIVSNYIDLEGGLGLIEMNRDVNFVGNDIDNLASLTSNATNPASAGIIRAGNAELISWRNAANTLNHDLRLNSSDQFEYRFNAVSEYTFSSTIFDVKGNSIDNVLALISDAAFPASAGVIRLGNDGAGGIKWRNNLNTADLYLQYGTTDHLIGTDGTFVTYDLFQDLNAANFGIVNVGYVESASGDVAGTGIFRMGADELVTWRNSSSTDDNSITFNLSDQFSINFDAVPKYLFSATTLDMVSNSIDNVSIFTSNAAIPASFGVIRIGYDESISWRDAGDTYDNRIIFSTTFQIISGSSIIYEITPSFSDAQGHSIRNMEYIEFANASTVGVGVLRLVNNEAIAWRNFADDGNLGFLFNTSDQFVFLSTVEVFGANIISNHPTLALTDPAADYLLALDATDGLVKKVLPNNLGLAGGSLDIKEVEIDFGSTPYQTMQSFTIADASVALTSQILVSKSIKSPSGGRHIDEIIAETLEIMAEAQTGQFVLTVKSIVGPITGKFIINYLVG